MYSFSKIVGQYCTSAWKEERHNTNLLSASLLPNNSQGWVEVRSLKPTGSLSCGWQGTHMLGPRLMPPSCILAGSWVGSGARTQTPALWYMRYGVPKCLLLFALFTVTHVRLFFFNCLSHPLLADISVVSNLLLLQTMLQYSYTVIRQTKQWNYWVKRIFI